MIALALAACTLEVSTVAAPDDAVVWTVADLWSGAAPSGQRVTVAEVVVTSPRSASGTTFYAQDPDGGPASGLQVMIGDGILDAPPAVGTPIQLTGLFVLAVGGPSLWLDRVDDLVVLGPPGEPVAWPFDHEPALAWALVRAEGVAITSSVDPSGIATTSLGRKLRPDLGAPTPGFGRTGDLTAISALGFALLLRTPDDWTGAWEGDPPLDVGLADLHDLPPGTPVRIPDLVQATPWSRGERYAVLQDAAGAGVWVDAEGFGAPVSAEGDVGTWVGEWRVDGEGPRLRVWTDPELTGARAPLTWTDAIDLAPDGALLSAEIAGLDSIGPRGDRMAGHWLLDDRFRSLEGLANGQTIAGAVRITTQGPRRLAVLP